jgi:Single cache domain 3
MSKRLDRSKLEARRIEAGKLLHRVLSAITPGDCWSADGMATIPDVKGGEARCVARIADRQRSRSGLSAPHELAPLGSVWSSTAGGQLVLGTAKLNGRNDIVDAVKDVTGAAATIFLEDTRIATNVTNP